MRPWSSNVTAAGARVTSAGTVLLVRHSRRVSRSGNSRIMGAVDGEDWYFEAHPWLRVGGVDLPLVTCLLFLGFVRAADRLVRLLLGLALDDHLAEVSRVFPEEFRDQLAVHLLVLDRQRVRFGVEFNDDVLLAGVWVTPEHDSHFSHVSGISVGGFAGFLRGLLVLVRLVARGAVRLYLL